MKSEVCDKLDELKESNTNTTQDCRMKLTKYINSSIKYENRVIKFKERSLINSITDDVYVNIALIGLYKLKINDEHILYLKNPCGYVMVCNSYEADRLMYNLFVKDKILDTTFEFNQYSTAMGISYAIRREIIKVVEELYKKNVEIVLDEVRKLCENISVNIAVTEENQLTILTKKK